MNLKRMFMDIQTKQEEDIIGVEDKNLLSIDWVSGNNRLLSTVCCLLSTVYCLLFTVYCLLSTVYCLLSAVYCLLSAVCCILHYYRTYNV